jgi:hypothetical protein
MAITRIISGGQTGADQGGLMAGEDLGLPTGGWAPRGWKTEVGAAPWLARFGLREFMQAGYPPRTRANVQDSDGTLLIGNPASRGSRLTERTARSQGKPVYIIVATAFPTDLSRHVEPFRKWILQHDIKVLNVAGNRESRNHGITDGTRCFLGEALS